LKKQFIPHDDLSDVILPLMRAKFKDEHKQIIEVADLFGTAFLIGKRGYAITAGHVIDQLHDELDPEKEAITTHVHNIHGLFPFEVIGFERHPTQDVGIIKINHDSFTSWLEIDQIRQMASAEYHSWGYPIETAKEKGKLVDGYPPVPTLIFTKGYIRRTINREIYPTMIYFGNAYYEVSDLGGGGYSGAPIIFQNSINHPKWKVIGVYVGEKSESPAVGYVIRSDSFYDWVPKMLGCTVREESVK
jgi:hypothetical protein